MESKLWDGTLAAIVGAVLGAISGGVSSWFITSRFEEKAQRSRAYDRFDEALDDLQTTATAYWRTNGQDFDKERYLKSQLEKVDLRLEALLRVLGQFQTSSRVRLDALTDEVTGGNFETHNRVADQNRVTSIKALCAEFRDSLHSA